MKTSKYYAATQEIESVALELESKGYTQLPDAGDNPTKLIINTGRKNYWLVDQICFELNAKTVVNSGQEMKILDNEILKTL